MRLFYFLFALAASLTLSAQEVLITGVMDGDEPGGTPKAIELYISGTVDLSNYSISRYTNANTMPEGTVLTLSGTYTEADTFLYIVNSNHVTEFEAAFGNSGNFENRLSSSVINGNGNDSYALSLNDVIIDVAGGEIGSSDNVYQDGYNYRVDNTGPDMAWVADNWTPAGNTRALDGQPISAYAGIVPFGTYSRVPPGPSISVEAGSDLSEPSTDGGFVLTLSEEAAATFIVNYTLSGSATVDEDYTDQFEGSIIVTAGQTTVGIPMLILDNMEEEVVEQITLTLTATSDATYTLGGPATINIFDDEPKTLTLISAVQGSGSTTPLNGDIVTVQGIVVGDFQGGAGTGLGGFFVQEEDTDQDGDPMTSEGIWIFEDSGVDVSVGDLVTVTGEAIEFSGLTEINANVLDGAVTIDPGIAPPLPAVTTLNVPPASAAAYEALEGMFIEVPGALTVTGTNNLGRFGEVEVSAGDRLIQFTECNTPDPAGLATYNAAQSLRRIIVDDGRSGSSVTPVVLPDGSELSATNTLRAGTTFTGLQGILDERFNGYRIQPTSSGTIAENVRPTTAPDVGGNLTVVGMNVLNYFTTLNDRGADNPEEFDRQEAKIVAAICELDADILGLVEIEENGTGAGSATQALIDAIAASCGKQYTAVVAPEVGTDAIKVQLIYDASVVEESGVAAALTEPAGVFSANRVPVAQTFRIIEAGNSGIGGQLTVTVNHFKSKGGSCGAGDDDLGGAGSCNGTRLLAANALRDWLASDPTGTGVMEQLVIGDLNAYSMEEPITAFTDNGYVNLVQADAPAGSFPCGGRPSYVFNGEWGSLDHALGSAALAPLVTGAVPWEVNASEPTVLDYNTEDNGEPLFAPDFYRFSDHNPVVVGIMLEAALPVELLSFSGRKDKGEVVLDWRTATERNTRQFEVERRDAFGNFATIGTVAATGESEYEVGYQYTDENPQFGENVYRLRALDFDGAESYSDLVTINIHVDNAVEAIRTEASTYRLYNAPIGTDYLLTDAAGAVVRAGRIKSASPEIEGATLPAGMYFLALSLPEGQGKVLKLLFGY